MGSQDSAEQMVVDQELPILPPSGLQEVVFSFDTTGSMSGCIQELRGRLQDMMQRLQADIPGIRIAVFAHGDYSDIYDTRHIDFTNNIANLCQFVNNTEDTHGGDFPECYELVLREVQTKLSWTDGSQRSLVMIGDAVPHDANYQGNKQNIDWKEEVQKLTGMGVRIYSVQWNTNTDSTRFFKHMADASSGKHLKLADFSNIFDFLMAICYREHGAEFVHTYENEVRARHNVGKIHEDLEGMFHSLRSWDKPADESSSDDDDHVTRACPGVSIIKPAVDLRTKSGKTLKRIQKPKSVKRLSRKGPKIERLIREKVPQTKFALNRFKWSTWTLAMVPSIPRGTQLWWVGRGENKPGFKRDKLFRANLNSPSVYEVSVQQQPWTKRVVVFSKFVLGRDNVQSWERLLLSGKDIQSQIDAVLESGSSVYIRRTVCDKFSVRKAGHELIGCYDYAWRRVRGGRKSHRDVIQNDVAISSSFF